MQPIILFCIALHLVLVVPPALSFLGRFGNSKAIIFVSISLTSSIVSFPPAPLAVTAVTMAAVVMTVIAMAAAAAVAISVSVSVAVPVALPVPISATVAFVTVASVAVAVVAVTVASPVVSVATAIVAVPVPRAVFLRGSQEAVLGAGRDTGDRAESACAGEARHLGAVGGLCGNGAQAASAGPARGGAGGAAELWRVPGGSDKVTLVLSLKGLFHSSDPFSHSPCGWFAEAFIATGRQDDAAAATNT